MNRLVEICVRCGRSLHSLLRELSDENAYSRHLAVTGHKHSRAEWQSFCDERLRKKYANGKCC